MLLLLLQFSEREEKPEAKPHTFLKPGQVRAAGLRPTHLPSLSLSQWPAGEGKAGKGPAGQKSTLFAKESPPT